MSRAPLFSLLCALAGLGFALAAPATASELVYVGTYTGAGSRGIYVLRFDPATGRLSRPRLAARTPDPSFLALSTDGRRLYAANENEREVSAFSVAPNSGKLRLIDRQATGGAATAHLALAPDGRLLVAANYGSGSVSVFPVAADGRIEPRSQLIQDAGPAGPNRARQSGPHAHSVTLSRDGRTAFVCDLGLDRVYVYHVNTDRARVVPAAAPFGLVPPGSGPRHSALSPRERYLYVISEMGGTVSLFSRDPQTDALTLRQCISTLPAGYDGFNGSAEVQLDRSGRFLYASNRGPDDLVVFARNAADGRLRPVQWIACGGSFPRNFSLSPDGRWLVCANQKTDNLTVFAVNPADGRLAATSAGARISQPVCVVFRP